MTAAAVIDVEVISNPSKALKVIQDKTRRARELQDALTSSRKNIEVIVDGSRKNMESAGSVLGDLRMCVTERDASFARKAVARLPGAKYIPGFRALANYMSLKDAIKQSYSYLQEENKKMEPQLKGIEEFLEEIEDQIKEHMANRSTARELKDKYELEKAELEVSIENLKESLQDLQPGSSEYTDKDDELLRAEQHSRGLQKQIGDQKRVILRIEDILNTLRVQAPTATNLHEAGHDHLDSVRSLMDSLEPYLQRNAQLAQLADSIEDAQEALQNYRVTQNLVQYALAERSTVIKQAVAEATGNPFIVPQIANASYAKAMQGRQLAEAENQKLLASPAGEIRGDYQLLGLDENEPMENVHTAYRAICRDVDPKTDPVRTQLAADAYQRILIANTKTLPPAVLGEEE